MRQRDRIIIITDNCPPTTSYIYFLGYIRGKATFGWEYCHFGIPNILFSIEITTRVLDQIPHRDATVWARLGPGVDTEVESPVLHGGQGPERLPGELPRVLLHPDHLAPLAGPRHLELHIYSQTSSIFK